MQPVRNAGCDQRLADPQWPGVMADIAHIRGERPGSARYAVDMTEAERNSIDNLLLLCPNHHRQIGKTEPSKWSADKLMEIKLKHEERCDKKWDEGELDHYASLLAASTADAPRSASSTRLVIALGSGDTFNVVNEGDRDAFKVRTENITEGEPRGLLRLEPGRLERLSPGARWRAGLWSRAMGSGSDPVIRVHWQDEAGTPFDADFPL